MQGKGKIETVGNMSSASLIFFTFNPLSPIPNSTRVIIHALDAEDFRGRGTKQGSQEICDFHRRSGRCQGAHGRVRSFGSGSRFQASYIVKHLSWALTYIFIRTTVCWFLQHFNFLQVPASNFDFILKQIMLIIRTYTRIYIPLLSPRSRTAHPHTGSHKRERKNILAILGPNNFGRNSFPHDRGWN